MQGWGKGKKTLAVICVLLVIGAIGNATSPPSNSSVAPTANKNSSQNKEQKLPSSNQPAKKIETKQVTETQAVPFDSTTQNDSTLAAGTTEVAVKGVNGIKTIIYKLTYTDGKESSRQEISETVTTQPINQITKVGTYVASTPTPIPDTGGPTALCNDGTPSYSAHHQGTCSHHGGVAKWY